MKTTLLVMALNEIDGMKAIMPKVDPSWVDQIILCDGGSTDGTVEWAKAQGMTVHVQSRPGFRRESAASGASTCCSGRPPITCSS